MTIPVPLAYPPTALRNVAAGLVVGNPIGSSGTRAKALTSAELKAIVEASGISYLPLSGGTLTGPITGTSGLIEQRNGLNAQCFDIFETYTSGTNNGKLRFKATSSGHQIGSARASSGSNRALQLGHFDSGGTFASALNIATDGRASFANSITEFGPNAWRFVDNGGSGCDIRTSGNLAVASFSGSASGITMMRGSLLYFQSTSGSYLDASSATSWALKTNGGGNVALTCGDVTFTPSASRTLSTNGHFSIEMTSNTAGNLVYRGSDGTTRRMALTFS